MAWTLAQLKSELLNDPSSLGYAALLADTNMPALAAALNLRRSTISMPRPDVAPLEILEAINLSDFLSNTNTYWSSWFESLTQFPAVRVLKTDGSDTRVMSNLLKLLTNGSASESRVRALAVRDGSRAEQLWGVNTVIGTQDVIDAIRS